MFRPPTKYSEYLQDVQKSIDYILKRVNATTVGGLPAGGTAGQILAKIDSTNYNAEWIDNYALWTSTLKHEVKAGQAINKGQAVYVSSADGTNMIVSKASNTTEVTSSKTMGLLAQSLAVNGKGFVITEGLLAGLDTSAANAAGDPVWLGADGNLLFGIANKPYAPLHMVSIGVVTRKNSSNGEIFVKVQNGFELDELHNVDARFPNNNDGIFYNSTTLLWEHKPVSDVYATPTLAQVTTAGNTTTNAITVGGLTSNGTLSVVASTAGAPVSIRNNNTSGVSAVNIFDNVGNNVGAFGYAGSTYGGTALQSKLYFYIPRDFIMTPDGSTNYFRVFTSTGNVAINTTTDAGYKLDVNGTARIATSLEITSASGISLGNLTALSYSGATLNIGSSASWSDIRFFTGGALKFSQISSLTTITNTTINLATTTVQLGGINALTYSGTDIRIGSVAAYFNSLSLYVAGSEKARILSNGNFLVGTTTDSGAKVTVSGSITAASALAQGVYFNNTLVAAANNDVLVGLDINPTFTNGAFTGVSNLALRVAYVSGRYISFTQRPGYTDYGRIQFTNVTGGDIYSSGRIDLIPNDTDQSVGLGNNLTSRRLASSTNYGLYGPTPPGFQVGTNAAFAVLSNNFDTNTDSFIFSGPTGARHFFKVVQNNVPYFTIMPTGNVLVNTTTDAGYKLDVNGTARVFTSLLVGSGYNTFSTYSGTDWAYNITGNESAVILAANIQGTTRTVYGVTIPAQSANLVLGTSYGYDWGMSFNIISTGKLGIKVNRTTDAALIFANGNWGIGTTTDAGYKLDVAGTVRAQVSLSGIPNIIHVSNLQTDGGPGGAIAFYTGGVIGNASRIVAQRSGSLGQSDIQLETNGVTRLFVHATNGNIGVGTSSPSYAFHIASSAAANVFGTVQSTNANGTAAWVAFNDQSDNVVYRVFGSGASGTQMGVPLARTASLIANLGGSGKFLIGTYSGTDVVFGAGDQERMRIVNSTGNVLVGTTTDAGYKFNVGGDINASGHVIAQTNLKSLYQSGDEGGEIFLNAPATNTTIPTGVTIDVYQNRLRIFQQGGSANGYYLDMPSGGAGVGTNLSPVGFTGTFTVPSNPVGQRNLNITNGIVISVS